jgi:ankyrin repeat protein
MPKTLPVRANLEWLKKVSKERLAELRTGDPRATLSDAQLAVARDYGFASWRKLKAHVDRLRAALDALTGNGSASGAVAPDDPELARLLEAVRTGARPVVATMLRARPGLARAHGEQGETALHVAAECDDPVIGVVLLAFGADPDAKFGDSGHTPLSWAVTCHALGFVRGMAQAGAALDLFCAAGSGSVDGVLACFDERGALRAGASKTGSSRYAADGTRLPCPPDSPAEQIADALYIAARTAQPDVVRVLLAHRPDLSFRAYMGGTPLHWAYFGGSRAVVDLLLAAGADPAARDHELGATPRAFAICCPASWGFDDLVRRRLSEDPSLATLMDGRTSALHEAARAGHTSTIQLLLDAGANPALLNGEGQTPGDLASVAGHAAVAAALAGKSTSPRPSPSDS